MLEPGGGGGTPVVVDAQELRRLANAARSARSAVDFALSRVAGVMGPLDRRGWNAGAADGTWLRARSGLEQLEADLEQQAAVLDERADLVDRFEMGQLGGDVPWFAGDMDTSTAQSVSDWSPEQKIEYALQRSLAHLPEELRRQLEAALTPQTLAWIVGIMVVWIAGQAFGYGELADGVIAVVGFAMLGPEAMRAGQELGGFVTGMAAANTSDDLDAAGAHLATVVSIVGVDGLMALLAHESGGAIRDAVGDGVPAAPGIGPQRVAVTAEGVEVILPPGFDPPPGADILEMAGGETPSTSTGKTTHRVWSDAQRAAGNFDEVGGPIDALTGDPIKVPRRVDLNTGQPQPNARLQVSKPDAVNYAQGRIVDLKPLGRALAKDRQEIIRFIRAFEQREGHLPQTIEIQRYDTTMNVVSVETYTPADFLPAQPVPPSSPDIVP